MAGDVASQREVPLRSRVRGLLDAERRRFVEEHPRSRLLFEQARGALLGGMPMNWMHRWPGAFPVFVASGRGARVMDVDGRTYIDFCLGDTGAMTGHAPAAAIEAAAARLRQGVTFMLPT